MPGDLTIAQAAAAAMLVLCWVTYSAMLRVMGREPRNSQPRLFYTSDAAQH